MVEPDAFEVGKDLACTPGAVVARTEVFELIQYEPTTETVHRIPMLMIPPMINKYYVTDLAPGRSMLEFFVAQGYQVFVVSWRNPEKKHSHWDLDTYGLAVTEALSAAREITKAPKVNLMGLCAGGITSSMVCAHLSATGQLDQVNSLALGVAVLDQTDAGTTVALMDQGTAAASILASRARGYMDGRTLAEIFAWLRPDDLIWNYWVNNYLQGKPPAFDILYWNADTTRMPAGLHRDFIEIAMDNALTKPGAASMLGLPSICPRSTSTATSWPASTTTSCPGRQRIRAPSCSVATSGSCCPPAGTLPPWSTRHRTRRRPSGSRQAPRPTTANGWPRPRRFRAAGGRTTPPGCRTAAVT